MIVGTWEAVKSCEIRRGLCLVLCLTMTEIVDFEIYTTRPLYITSSAPN